MMECFHSPNSLTTWSRHDPLFSIDLKMSSVLTVPLKIFLVWLQINLSYCSVTDVGLLSLASINCLRNMTILHLAGLTPDGLTAALLVCGGLRKVKLHLSFKSSLPPSFLKYMETRGCALYWRDKAFQVFVF